LATSLIIFSTGDKVALRVNDPTFDEIVLFEETFNDCTIGVVLHTFALAHSWLSFKAFTFVSNNLAI
jgi:hypothetical protein